MRERNIFCIFLLQVRVNVTILSHSKPVCAGSGKTLPGLLNAALMDEGRVTLWILPLQSMHHHYRMQCQKLDISCETWTPKSSLLAPKTNVLVTVELTQLQVFKDYVANLRARGRLARIIIDEIHLVVTHASFRPSMESLTWMGAAGCQVVLQTATLPPVLQERVLKALGLTTCQVVRAKTCRCNISINVVKCPSQSLYTVVKQCFDNALSYSTEGRIMLFCRSKSKAEEIGTLLDIPVCHSAMDREKVDGVLNELYSGTKRAVASTSLLGVAVDVPQVTHVIHVECPYDIISYAQEAGRAGRDGSPAWSYILLPQDLPRRREKDKEDLFGIEALQDIWQDDRTCRRLAIQVFLDGAAEPCSMMGGIEHFCDVCMAQSTHMPDRQTNSAFPWTSVRRVLKSLPTPPQPDSYYSPTPLPMHLQTAAAHASRHQPPAKPTSELSIKLQKVHHLMERLALTCVACWLRGLQGDHLLADCPRRDSPTDKNREWQKWESAMREDVAKIEGVCYSCTCSQDVSSNISFFLPL
jgi:superfamily II DNA helicase RecQ